MSKKNELVIVLDFGGQYNQLIARRVRECNVYCEIKPYTISLEELKELNPKGIIFTGGCSKSNYGALAQLVEHLTFNQVVRGSNPRCFTTLKVA